MQPYIHAIHHTECSSGTLIYKISVMFTSFAKDCNT